MNTSALQHVDLATESGDPVDGLVSVVKPPKDLPASERIVVEKAASHGEVAWVFFRRFNDGRSSQPVAFVIDNSDERLTHKDLANLHNALWLNAAAPLVYVAWSTRIDVLSCARGPDFWDGNQRIYSPAAELEIASKIASQLDAARRFSANRLADGTFWDNPQNHPLANHEKGAHESLIQAIVETDRDLGGETNPTLRRLLLLTVLIKYLEDRDVFPGPGWFGHFHKGARSFFDVLKSEDPECVLRLLHNLEAKFNGDVFALPSEAKLTAKSLRKFASLVEARTLKQQRYLWEQFSFSHLPVEVISHLYQRFVKGSTAVYTPPFLAALLLDFAMPYHKLTGKERVLDPSCGSGVFLVGAFRRLINASRSKNKWKTPDVETLKSILRKQIFGVELDGGAVDLTAFSLALAVCDSLQPNVIWNELRFDRLRDTNLFEGDFFDYALADVEETDKSLGKFDVVIGNPPFESEFSEPARQINGKFTAERGAIPDKQIAYLFLDQAIRTTTNNGVVTLIQPAGFLYNLRVLPFRQEFLTQNSVQLICDFTSIRDMYEGADTKSIAIIANRTLPAVSSKIRHLTFRRFFTSQERVHFEIDHYDCHDVKLKEAIQNPAVWRANLVGGGRLRSIAEKWAMLPTVGDYVRNQGWLSGEGFIVGRRNETAPYLTGLRFLPTEALTENGMNEELLGRVLDTKFQRPRSSELYDPPMVVIREHNSLASAYWNAGRLAFNQKIVGIHARPEQSQILLEFHETLKRLRIIHQAACTLRSSEYLAGRATSISKADILSLPFPTSDEKMVLTHWEDVLVSDLIEYMAPFVRRGQNATALKVPACPNDLVAYSTIFCRMLGSVYDNLLPAEPVFLDGLICQPFYFGEEPSIEWLGPDCKEQLETLIYDEAIESLRTIRVVRLYHENVIFIVKPDRLRYWIRSTAIRDADDTLVDLQQQGY